MEYGFIAAQITIAIISLLQGVSSGRGRSAPDQIQITLPPLGVLGGRATGRPFLFQDCSWRGGLE
ncbi:MAG: hypothetical protein KUG65_10410 [Sphingomonadaceae bacterium]|nr:hypothetical protein [Sphingomonadaceae bacterium]